MSKKLKFLVGESLKRKVKTKWFLVYAMSCIAYSIRCTNMLSTLSESPERIHGISCVCSPKLLRQFFILTADANIGMSLKMLGAHRTIRFIVSVMTRPATWMLFNSKLKPYPWLCNPVKKTSYDFKLPFSGAFFIAFIHKGGVRGRCRSLCLLVVENFYPCLL